MSITVAVNAADSTNGPQAVCQTVQHNNCVEYNGGGDMAVFDHENDQHDQVPNTRRYYYYRSYNWQGSLDLKYGL